MLKNNIDFGDCEVKPVRSRNLKKKKVKHDTACVDKRKRYFNCGICGSEDVVFQGVAICASSSCQHEEIVIIPDDFLGIKCSKCGYYCNFIGVKKCAECGAVKGPLCPSCKRASWKRGEQQHCIGGMGCGFQKL